MMQLALGAPVRREEPGHCLIFQPVLPRPRIRRSNHPRCPLYRLWGFFCVQNLEPVVGFEPTACGLQMPPIVCHDVPSATFQYGCSDSRCSWCAAPCYPVTCSGIAKSRSWFEARPRHGFQPIPVVALGEVPHVVVAKGVRGSDWKIHS